MCLIVRVDDLLLDPTAGGDVVPVGFCPLPDVWDVVPATYRDRLALDLTGVVNVQLSASSKRCAFSSVRSIS
jgi:hypothetical protein